MSANITKPGPAGTHGWRSSCMPTEKHASGYDTFSIGIFEWVPRANGKGVKSAAVKLRVSGPVGKPQLVVDKAKALIAELDAGTYKGPKNVKV